MKYLLLCMVVLTGCSTSPIERRQQHVLGCVKELKEQDSATLESFEVCRQVYGLKKLKE